MLLYIMNLHSDAVLLFPKFSEQWNYFYLEYHLCATIQKTFTHNTQHVKLILGLEHV